VVVPTLIGEIEQDYMFWPLKYKAIAEDWRLHTPWGELFQRYQQAGCLGVHIAEEAGIPMEKLKPF
jgi:hypothetical protein